MECHHLKGGDFLRLSPHTFHSLLPKATDPLVQENYNRTGIVGPDQLNDDFIELVRKQPQSKCY